MTEKKSEVWEIFVTNFCVTMCSIVNKWVGPGVANVANPLRGLLEWQSFSMLYSRHGKIVRNPP